MYYVLCIDKNIGITPLLNYSKSVERTIITKFKSLMKGISKYTIINKYLY